MLTFMSLPKDLTLTVCQFEFTGNGPQQSVLTNLSKKKSCQKCINSHGETK